MAHIGMKYLVAAPITTHTEGSEPTYGSGFVVGPAVAADINFEYENAEDRGDDVVVNSDEGMIGYNGSVEANDIDKDVREKLLGWVKITTGEGQSATVSHYEGTADDPPAVGYGYMRITEKPYNGGKKIEAFWFKKAKFTPASISDATKRRNIEYRHPKMNIKGEAVYLNSLSKNTFFKWMEFTSESAAKTWLNTLAGISSGTGT